MWSFRAQRLGQRNVQVAQGATPRKRFAGSTETKWIFSPARAALHLANEHVAQGEYRANQGVAQMRVGSHLFASGTFE